jgi:HEAT repeat protein
VVESLRAAGFPVEHIEDLYKDRYRYRSAVPVLVDALERTAAADVAETIVRALSVPYARGWARSLVAQFSRFPDAREHTDAGFHFKWAVGNALAVVADDSVFDEVVGLIRDPTHGQAREMLVVGLANMRLNDPEPLLIELLGAPDVAPFAAIALGKRGASRAAERLRALLDDADPRARTEARKALRRIEGRR